MILGVCMFSQDLSGISPFSSHLTQSTRVCTCASCEAGCFSVLTAPPNLMEACFVASCYGGYTALHLKAGDVLHFNYREHTKVGKMSLHLGKRTFG